MAGVALLKSDSLSPRTPASALASMPRVTPFTRGVSFDGQASPEDIPEREMIYRLQLQLIETQESEQVFQVFIHLWCTCF